MTGVMMSMRNPFPNDDSWHQIVDDQLETWSVVHLDPMESCPDEECRHLTPDNDEESFKGRESSSRKNFGDEKQKIEATKKTYEMYDPQS